MKPKRCRASKAQVMLRRLEIYRIRLAAAKLPDIVEYIREQEQTDGSPWKLAEGAKPMSEAQICVYIKHADKTIAESTRERRRQSLVKHLARREDLYARALDAGEIRTALAVDDSAAKLRGLFPPTKIAPTTPDGSEPWTPWAATLKDLSDEELAILVKLAERGRQVAAGDRGNRTN